MGQTVGVVDVGFRTSEYLLMLPVNGTHVPDIHRSGSIDVGAGHVYEMVVEAVSSQTGTLVPEAQVMAALHDNAGKLLFRGETIDLIPTLEAAARTTAGQIEGALRREWAGHTDFLGGLLALGGGAYLLNQWLTLAHVHVPDEPVLANARGFLAFREAARHVG